MNRWTALAAFLALGIVAAQRSSAALAATTGPSCDLISPGFSVTYDPTAITAKTEVGVFHVVCTTASALTVSVKLSQGLSASFTDREMVGPGGTPGGYLHYNLFYASTGNIFGDGTGGTQYFNETLQPVNNVARGSAAMHLRVKPRQFLQPGAYNDTLMLTMEF